MNYPQFWSDRTLVWYADNMDILPTYEDNHFDLGILDPPYGIGEDGKSNHTRGNKAKAKQYTPKDWDKEPPPPEYFAQVLRVCRHVIIFGANHFLDRLPCNHNASCWIIWNKDNGKTDQADFEMAWTNLPGACRMFTFKWQGMLQGNMKDKEQRIHPTQKPVSLYRAILEKYAQPGWKILDTHQGSASLAIAAYHFGCEYEGIEKDGEYIWEGWDRFDKKKIQNQLF